MLSLVKSTSSALHFYGQVLCFKSTNAKVTWKDVCRLKNEGGLGLRDLKEVNKVYGLKLIWRMLSGESLWRKWIRNNLLKGNSFWEVKSKTQMGSWMWRKMLKLREVAKSFYRKELGNGRHTSFWYDSWLDRGVLVDLLGARGIIDMGVHRVATVEEAILTSRRRRRHRLGLLNDIEAELIIIAEKLSPEKEDVSLWRGRLGFKQKFSTHETWGLLRNSNISCSWARGIWFAHATPKFAFMAWLSMLDRMSTLDRIAKWNQGINTICVLCKSAPEIRNHLFFMCAYTSQIWEHIARGVLCSSYTNVWSEIVSIIGDETMERKRLFCVRYAFQAVLYAVWRERNKIIHGEKLLPLSTLKSMIDKGIRNKITLMRNHGVKGMGELM